MSEEKDATVPFEEYTELLKAHAELLSASNDDLRQIITLLNANNELVNSSLSKNAVTIDNILNGIGVLMSDLLVLNDSLNESQSRKLLRAVEDFVKATKIRIPR